MSNNPSGESPKIKLSVIVPTCREPQNALINEMAQSYPKRNDIEYIVVDSGSHPDLTESWQRAGWKVHELLESNRAQRLQMGYNLSKGQIVIFHHPRSLLELETLDWLVSRQDQLSWGGFTHRFDFSHWALKWTSFYSNRIRPRVSGILYLDHCFYFRRELLDREIPPVPIFEDTEISIILRRHGLPRVLPFFSTTLAIRFQTNGIFRQLYMNQKMKLQYLLGRDRKSMNASYERGLELNE